MSIPPPSDKEVLDQLSRANKNDTWIHSDLSITKSNAFGRIFWKVFAKHFDWSRRFFFNVNLDASMRLLINLKDRVKQNQSLLESYNKAVLVFNAITSKKYHIPQEEIRDLEIVPQATPEALIAVLNGAARPSVDTLLKMITPKTSNVRIYVKEPAVGVLAGDREKYKDTKIKSYSLATDAQIMAEKMPSGNDLEPDPRFNHTTTLTNIITTNELGFTPEEIARLVNKLIEVKADFTAIDYTNYRALEGFVSIQNNPLRSLIALGSQNSNFDQTISQLIDYIGSLQKETQQIIFSHKDRYLLGSMSLIYFLVRQGKEDLALKLVKLMAPLEPHDLLFACFSFGTVPGKASVQAECIREMYKRLTLSKEDQQKCFTALKLLNEEWEEQMRQRGENAIKTWPDYSSYSMCSKVLTRAGMTIKDLSNPSLHEKLLQAFVDEQASHSNVGNQRLSDDYRPPDIHLGLEKYRNAKTEEGGRLLKELLALMSGK